MKNIIYIIVGIVALISIIGVVFMVVKNKIFKELKKEAHNLERERNIIEGIPIDAELEKLKVVTQNEKISAKKTEWYKRYETIKNKDIPNLTDLIVDVDGLIEVKKRKEARDALAKLDIEVYKVKVSCENLLEEIQEITMSEERNRNIIIKLKAKYRELKLEFDKKKESYGFVSKFIDLQFENIEKKFQDFEDAMDAKEFNEVVSIVKVIDEMIAHISVIIDEVPDIVLLIDTIIPARIKEITETSNKLIEKNYPIEYLKVEYNLEEINKKISLIVDRLKILNIEDSMFELKTFLDYLDNLFNDFELEKRSKKYFDEISKSFKTKINKINQIVSDIYAQIDDIKGMYNLSDNDLNNLNEVNKNLLNINMTYNGLIKDLKEHNRPYSALKREVDVLTNRLQSVEFDLDICLKSLGSMHDDELRAREQLDEITSLLKKCRKRMREYNLPIVSNNYFVELAEANEAIYEIIKELEKTPITIKTLNVRVDTARDLALKLYNTTNEMIKTAQLSEMIIVYGNRYKPLDVKINEQLDTASMLFFKGNYKKSLETSINAINIIEPDIYKKMLHIYSNENK